MGSCALRFLQVPCQHSHDAKARSFSLQAAPGAARVTMRNFQNIISTFGNVLVRQGNQLVVRIESLRYLRATFLSALPSYASELAIGLRDDAWQALYLTWLKPHVCTVGSFASPITGVVKQGQRRHQIMGHRTAA